MDAAVAALRREQILVTRITPAKGKAEAAAKKARPKRRQDGRRPKNLAVFTRQFSVMIDAGLPLVQCLDILGYAGRGQELRRRHPADADRRRSRAPSLADAMRKHPKTFDPLFTNMIAAGEAGGILDTILKRLATYIEKAVKLKGQVKSAMVYPVAVIVIAGASSSAVILWKVIPTFAAMFARPRRRAAAADAHRHRDERQPRAVRRRSLIVGDRLPSATRSRSTTQTDGGRPCDRRASC